jgi:hypothetical protein
MAGIEANSSLSKDLVLLLDQNLTKVSSDIYLSVPS